jgi:hypothetical protein
MGSVGTHCLLSPIMTVHFSPQRLSYCLVQPASHVLSAAGWSCWQHCAGALELNAVHGSAKRLCAHLALAAKGVLGADWCIRCAAVRRGRQSAGIPGLSCPFADSSKGFSKRMTHTACVWPCCAGVCCWLAMGHATTLGSVILLSFLGNAASAWSQVSHRALAVPWCEEPPKFRCGTTVVS